MQSAVLTSFASVTGKKTTQQCTVKSWNNKAMSHRLIMQDFPLAFRGKCMSTFQYTAIYFSCQPTFGTPLEVTPVVISPGSLLRVNKNGTLSTR